MKDGRAFCETYTGKVVPFDRAGVKSQYCDNLGEYHRSIAYIHTCTHTYTTRRTQISDDILEICYNSSFQRLQFKGYNMRKDSMNMHVTQEANVY